MSNPLREERAYFAELKPQLLESHTGQFAVIRGRELFGVFPQQDDAFVKGVKRFKRGAATGNRIRRLPIRQIG